MRRRGAPRMRGGGDVARCHRMWTRIVAKLMALVGLYAIVIAGLSMRFSGQRNSSSFNLTLGELGLVTLIFLAIAAFVLTRRPKRPLDD